MNRTVHSATAHQSTVGCIDDRIDGFLGDVADLYNHPTIEKASWEIHVFSVKTSGSVYLLPLGCRNNFDG